ncbi:T9SS C-terminal target domain-containing protein [candidate division KSB1 bacterium]|nr:T9SS type A sorting domain-containing protein [candidate division KSB1 bacterium]RQW02343.1 MAG: T9SS C-terminal target domain-containing protein [candidate division KSB1 bacterium]
MKRVTILCALGCFFLLGATHVLAQDTLDVAQGLETLNLAVEGDTLADGSPANPNRVYRLERGGYYLLNGTVNGNGGPLRIVAAEGDGPKPILISLADETGSSSRYFRPGVDAEWRGLYISGIDNLGNQAEKNTFRLGKEGGRYIIDDCVVDGDAQSMIRIDADDQSLFVTNSIFSNSYLLSDPANGRFMDTRGNLTDTLFVQNCTFFNNSHDLIRNGGGIVKHFVWDHITFNKAGAWDATIESDRNVYNQITNNLVMDYGWEGRLLLSVDSTGACFSPVDTLDADSIATEAERKYITANNVMGWSPEVRAWINSKDSLQFMIWTDATGQLYYDTFDNFLFEDNIEEDVVFSDGPENTYVVAMAEHRYNDDYANNGNPEIRLDRNGWGTLTDDPASFGPAADEYDFDYATTFKAYTHAVGGFPAGDLNWFPDKKAEWIAAGKPTTAVESRPVSTVPNQFELSQNYPNPFNPTTEIQFKLNTPGMVSLTVYNAIGQHIRSLVQNEFRQAGIHAVTWNGRDDAGSPAPSGLYFYRLTSGLETHARKMILMK